VDRSLADTCLGMLRYGRVQRVGRGRYVATEHMREEESHAVCSANAAQTQKGRPMAEDRLACGIVRGAPEERFIQITMDARFSTMKPMSDPMTEDELRVCLRQHGLEDAAIAACIQHARQHPV
jgi:hypothetical protein